jgi:hypothetical protein
MTTNLKLVLNVQAPADNYERNNDRTWAVLHGFHVHKQIFDTLQLGAKMWQVKKAVTHQYVIYWRQSDILSI